MLASEWPIDVTVVVRGHNAAEAAYDEADREISTLLDPPRACGDGWWLIEGSITMRALEALEAHLDEAALALMFVGDTTEQGYVRCFEPDQPTLSVSFGFPDRPAPSSSPTDTEPDLTAWLRRYAPKRRSGVTIARLWSMAHGDTARGVAATLLKGVGWKYERFDVINLLDGCKNLMVWQHNYIGETQVDWTTCRWVLGSSDSYYGMWDLDAPGQPVERWPRTSDGARQAQARQYDLVARPILARTRLPGDRRWSPIAEPVNNADGVFFHFSPRKQIHIVWTTSPEPLTYRRSEVGSARLTPEWASIVGLTPATEFEMVSLPLVDVADAERAASALVNGRVAWTSKQSGWRPLPESVPGTILDTWKWVRRQTERRGVALT